MRGEQPIDAEVSSFFVLLSRHGAAQDMPAFGLSWTKSFNNDYGVLRASHMCRGLSFGQWWRKRRDGEAVVNFLILPKLNREAAWW